MFKQKNSGGGSLAALQETLKRIQYQLVEEMRAHLSGLASSAEVVANQIKIMGVKQAAVIKRIDAIEAALEKAGIPVERP